MVGRKKATASKRLAGLEMTVLIELRSAQKRCLPDIRRGISCAAIKKLKGNGVAQSVQGTVLIAFAERFDPGPGELASVSTCNRS